MRNLRINPVSLVPDEKSRGGGIYGVIPSQPTLGNEGTSSAGIAAKELLRLIRRSPGKYPPGVRRVITTNLQDVPGHENAFDLTTTLEPLVRRSLNRSRQALLIWDEVVGGIKSGELKDIQIKSDAASYLRSLRKDVEEQEKFFRTEMAQGQMTADEAEFFNSVHKLSLSQVTILIDEVDAFVHTSGSSDIHVVPIANAAALTATCCFLAEMICRGRRCANRVIAPLVNYFQETIIDVKGMRGDWPVIVAEMHLAEVRAAAISSVINNAFKDQVVRSDSISDITRAQVSTAIHVANHISQILHSVEYYKSEIESVFASQVINRSNIEGLLSTFQEIDRSLGSLHAIPFSHEEPSDFVKRAFRCVKALRMGDVPQYVDRRALNMMLTHFVLNAKQYASFERPLEVRLLQSELGVLLQDNGRGMTPQRLALLQDAIGRGGSIKSLRPGGTGNGIRDSVSLLVELLEKNPEIGQVSMTIASKEHVGTSVDVRWDGKLHSGIWDHVQISCELQSRDVDNPHVMITVRGSVNRPTIVLSRAFSSGSFKAG